MDRRTTTRISKFLSLVLRHRPDEYGLRMDDRGAVDFADLIDVLAAEDVVGENAEEIVQDLVDGSDRRRFAIENGRIRALYGHSARIHLDYPAQDPPTVLYHGTTPEAARRIAEEGLKPAGRAYVHLSATEEEAMAVGHRYTEEPILIRIDTAAAREHGVKFHEATELIWLCSDLSADVCDVPEIPDDVAEEPRPARRPEPGPAPAQPPPASPAEGARVIEPDKDEGFKRRTRRRTRR